MNPGEIHDMRVLAKASLAAEAKPAPGSPMWYERRIRELEAQKEAQELALSYAQDIVNSWPSMTLRTLSQMTNKINAMREALELAKK